MQARTAGKKASNHAGGGAWPSLAVAHRAWLRLMGSLQLQVYVRQGRVGQRRGAGLLAGAATGRRAGHDDHPQV